MSGIFSGTGLTVSLQAGDAGRLAELAAGATEKVNAVKQDAQDGQDAGRLREMLASYTDLAGACGFLGLTASCAGTAVAAMRCEIETQAAREDERLQREAWNRMLSDLPAVNAQLEMRAHPEPLSPPAVRGKRRARRHGGQWPGLRASRYAGPAWREAARYRRAFAKREVVWRRTWGKVLSAARLSSRRAEVRWRVEGWERIGCK